MDKRTYHACLVISIIVQAVPLQAADFQPLRHEDMLSTMSTHEARTATTIRTKMPTVSSKETANSTILHNASSNWNTFAITVNTTSFSPLLSDFAQSTHSRHTKAKSSSDITAETKTEVATFPTESFLGNSTHQATVKDSKVTTSAITLKLTSQPSRSIPLISSKGLVSVSAIPFPEEADLKKSEVILTIGFAIVLALTILGFTVYILNKYKKLRNQYSHRPLYDASSEIVDRYATPDDTLVISGGLYDAPRLYNPNMTVYEDDELQNENLPFSTQRGQFRLEFLPGEQENDLSPTYETFQMPPGGL
ncbi:uncharacterized protein LOC134410479 isoform X2 [Elgaria multicarinata webbii]|uniref:uncharacterized protein LOC134410479 isoform X2 n=1 Tax=Elgaria multicarinata webbii TaxID=159646 RepID=UPI002FCD2205